MNCMNAPHAVVAGNPVTEAGAIAMFRRCVELSRMFRRETRKRVTRR
jgi:hypothetical protein